MRSNTKDENMRNFYKLMNNAVYGKTMYILLLFKIFQRENIFKRCKYIITNSNDSTRIRKLVQTGKIDKLINLTDNILIGKRNHIPTFDKAIYVGFCILELSKTHMYFLLYDVIKPKWPESQLMYM